MRHTTSLKQQLQHGGEGGGGGERERLQLQQRRSRSLVAANAKDKELEELMRSEKKFPPSCFLSLSTQKVNSSEKKSTN